MGNRANVVFHDNKKVGPVVYLHWNGGPESVYAFLAEMDRRNCRGTGDLSYCTARFCHIVGDFFDQDEATALSLGVYEAPAIRLATFKKRVDVLDHGDNGVFLIGGRRNTWEVERYVGKQWWGPDTVRREAEEAREHEYHAALAAVFRELRPTIARFG